MAKNTKKLIVAIAFVAILCFGGVDRAAAATNYELTLQMQSIQRQILLLRIQLIQQRIADLQAQLAAMTSNKYVDIIYPNGGEKMENQHGYYIRWESKGVDKVTIVLDKAGNETTIAGDVKASEGRYYWNTENRIGSEYNIRIFDPQNSGTSDKSSGNFTLFDNSNGDKCSDGTVAGKCSTDKPKLCFDTDIDLTNACHSCGCPSGETCRTDGSCN